MPHYRIREVADLLGVSPDTVRRWADAGKLETTTDSSGRHVVEGTVLASFAQEHAETVRAGSRTPGGAQQSVRNRFPGLVTRVVRDTVMAQV